MFERLRLPIDTPQGWHSRLNVVVSGRGVANTSAISLFTSLPRPDPVHTERSRVNQLRDRLLQFFCDDNSAERPEYGVVDPEFRGESVLISQRGGITSDTAKVTPAPPARRAEDWLHPYPSRGWFFVFSENWPLQQLGSAVRRPTFRLLRTSP